MTDHFIMKYHTHVISRGRVILSHKPYTFEFKPAEIFKPLGFDCEGRDRTTKIVMFKIGMLDQIKACGFNTFAAPPFKEGDELFRPIDGHFKDAHPYNVAEVGNIISLGVEGPFTKMTLWGVTVVLGDAP